MVVKVRAKLREGWVRGMVGDANAIRACILLMMLADLRYGLIAAAGSTPSTATTFSNSKNKALYPVSTTNSCGVRCDDVCWGVASEDGKSNFPHPDNPTLLSSRYYNSVLSSK